MSLPIPTYNERDVLVRLLDNLRVVELADGFKWEVIVVDNNSPTAASLLCQFSSGLRRDFM